MHILLIKLMRTHTLFSVPSMQIIVTLIADNVDIIGSISHCRP